MGAQNLSRRPFDSTETPTMVSKSIFCQCLSDNRKPKRNRQSRKSLCSVRDGTTRGTNNMRTEKHTISKSRCFSRVVPSLVLFRLLCCSVFCVVPSHVVFRLLCCSVFSVVPSLVLFLLSCCSVSLRVVPSPVRLSCSFSCLSPWRG